MSVLPPSTLATFPLELLQSIFEHLIGGRYVSISSRNLFPCMKVCRRWKDAVEPLFYSRLTLVRMSQIQKFGEIIQESGSSGWILAKHVKCLEISLLARDLNDVTDILVAALPQFINLQDLDLDFGMTGTLLVATSLAITSQICAASLQDVHLRVHCSDLRLIFSCLSSFVRLRSVYLFVDDGATDASHKVRDDEHWAMENVQLLTVSETYTSPRSGSLILQYLAKCALPRLQRLDFDVVLGNLDNTQLTADMCSRWSLQFADIRFSRDDEQDHIDMVLAEINARELQTWHMPSIIRPLSKHVRDLRIIDPPGYEQVWLFLDSLLGNETNVRNVYMQDWEGMGEEWLGEPDEEMDVNEALNWARVLRYASKLSKKGVMLRDHAGNVVTDYFSYP